MATDFFENNLWHLEQQAEGLDEAGRRLLQQAESLRRIAANLRRYREPPPPVDDDGRRS